MRVIVYGAGGVGGTIGARLIQQGVPVVLIARGAHLEALRGHGLRFVTPQSVFNLEVDVVGHPRDIDWRPDDLVLLTMKSQHTAAALDELALVAAADTAIVCGQNGVANERMALRRFPNVYGMLVNLPALHLTPGEVVTYAEGTGGILDTGRYPDGSDDVADTFTALLRAAGFSAWADAAIMRKKYAKLLMNLGNVIQAASAAEGAGLDDTDRDALGAVHRVLRQEALRCFDAAGIDCASRDEVRARHEDGYRTVDVPGYSRTGGSSWQSISRGTGNLETDYLNGEISLLGRLHGVPTPGNSVCLELARQMLRERLPAGSIRPREILERIEAQISH